LAAKLKGTKGTVVGGTAVGGTVVGGTDGGTDVAGATVVAAGPHAARIMPDITTSEMSKNVERFTISLLNIICVIGLDLGKTINLYQDGTPPLI
jgi:hypothetical protein